MLLTRSPLSENPKTLFTFDLHVLSTPPAFILSQDQTLHKEFDSVDSPGRHSVARPTSPDSRPFFKQNLPFCQSVLASKFDCLTTLQLLMCFLPPASISQHRCALYPAFGADTKPRKQGLDRTTVLPAFRRGKCVVYTTCRPLSNRSPRFCVILLRHIQRPLRIPLPPRQPDLSRRPALRHLPASLTLRFSGGVRGWHFTGALLPRPATCRLCNRRLASKSLLASFLKRDFHVLSNVLP